MTPTSCFRRFLIAAAVLAAATTGSVVAGGPAQAAESSSQLLLVMDSSGSMAGPDGAGSTKIDAAKGAIDKVVDTAPADATVGLRVYGADRDKNDPAACRDTQLLVPVGQIEAGRIKHAAASMSPRGQTPIAYSLQQAAKDFPNDQPRTILLVSDGIETCNPNPCKVASQLEAAGIQLRIDVVGFRVDEQARTQLECIARAGHGTYYDATDGPSLQSHVTRSSTRALRQYRPTGTPVDGTPDPVDAPTITPGQYLDTMPPKGEGEGPSKYYTFQRGKGETMYAVATVVPPITFGNSTDDGVDVAIENSAGDTCDYGTGGSVVTGGGTEPASATARLSTDPGRNEDTDCERPGTYRVKVLNNTISERRQPVSMELLLLAEPPASDTQALPPQAPDDGPQVKTAEPAGPGTTVAGGGSFTDAPILGNGTYADSIRPGETLFYRTKLAWGQRLAYRLDFGPVGATTQHKSGYAGGPEVHLTADGPTRSDANAIFADNNNRDGIYAGQPQTFWGSTPLVRYRNREASSDGIKAASLAGYYYVQIHLTTRSNDPNFQAPFRLTLDAQGTPTGAPHYRKVSDGTPVGQQDSTPSSQPSPTPSAPATPASTAGTASAPADSSAAPSPSTGGGAAVTVGRCDGDLHA